MNAKSQKNRNKPLLQFRKSSFSPASEECVGVCFHKGNVFVTNTKLKRRKIIEFTEGEWRAFILGAQNGEFDL